MTEPLKLGIGIPAYGFHLDAGHAAMWLGLGAALFEARDKIELMRMTEYHINGIDLCRNTIVYDAMQSGCDWVLMIDADTFHRSTGENGVADAIADAGVDIVQMIRDADRNATAAVKEDGQVELTPIQALPQRTGVALVGAPVRGRGLDGANVCVEGFRYAESPDEPGYDYWVTQGTRIPLEDLAGRVQPVGRIGAACIAVNCNWLRRYWDKAPWFEMKYDYEGRPKYMSGEDYTICDGIWKRGGVVLCDGRFVPAHVARRKLVGEP